MNGELYVIRNKVNGKEYVGKTYKGIKTRFRQHLEDAYKERYENRPLYKAFQKYGLENFEIESIGYYPEIILEEKEMEEIAKRDTYRNGYNATMGGDGTRRISLPMKEVYDYYIKTRSFVKTGRKFGCSSETIRAALKDYDFKRFYNYDSMNNQFIPNIVEGKFGNVKISFDSTANAAEFLKKTIKKDYDQENIRKCISRVLSGNRKSYLGINWKKF